MASARHPAIGPRLRALRVQLKWSQNQLSELSGLRRIEISALESGRNLGSSWRVRTLLAKGFGLKKLELDAYLEGASSPGELAAKCRARSTEKRTATNVTSGTSAENTISAELFAKFPNLREAARIVAKDAGADQELVLEVASRLAANQTLDKKIMDWAGVVKEEFDRFVSGTRINPLRVPNLAAAIRMLASENPIGEPHLKVIAARLVAERSDPMSTTTIEWVRALDRALAAPSLADPAQAKRGAGRQRGANKS